MRLLSTILIHLTERSFLGLKRCRVILISALETQKIL